MGVTPAYTVRVAEDPADREACFTVRKEVFVAEQGVAEDIEYDAYDAVAVHVLAVREDGVPLGTGCLLYTSWCAPSRTRHARVASRRWTCTRRPTPWASTSGSVTRRTARSSRTRAYRTGRCAGPCSQGCRCRPRGSRRGARPSRRRYAGSRASWQA